MAVNTAGIPMTRSMPVTILKNVGLTMVRPRRGANHSILPRIAKATGVEANATMQAATARVTSGSWLYRSLSWLNQRLERSVMAGYLSGKLFKMDVMA